MPDPINQLNILNKFPEFEMAVTLSPIIKRASVIFEVFLPVGNKDPLYNFLRQSLENAQIFSVPVLSIVRDCFEVNPNIVIPAKTIKYQINPTANSNGGKLMRALFGVEVDSFCGAKPDLLDLLTHQAVFLTNRDTHQGARLTLESARAILTNVLKITEVDSTDPHTGYRLTKVGQDLIEYANQQLAMGGKAIKSAIEEFAGNESLITKLNGHYDTKLVRRKALASDASNSITDPRSRLLSNNTVSATSINYDASPYQVEGITIYHAAGNPINDTLSFMHQIISAAICDYCITQIYPYQSPKKTVLVLNQFAEIGMIDSLSSQLLLQESGELLKSAERYEIQHLAYRKTLHASAEISKLLLYIPSNDPFYQELKGYLKIFTNCVANLIHDDHVFGSTTMPDILRAGHYQRNMEDLITYQNFLSQLWKDFRLEISNQAVPSEVSEGLLANHPKFFRSILDRLA